MKNTRQKRTIALDLEGLGYLYARVPFLIQRVEQIMNALFALQHSEQTTPAQIQMLGLLTEGPMLQTELSSSLGTDKSTTGLVINNLLKQGLIIRETDEEDRRRKPVSLTPVGRSHLAEARKDLKKAEGMLLSPLGPAERQQLIHWLKVLAGDHAATEEKLWIHESPSWILRRCLQAIEARLTSEAGMFGLTLRQDAMLHVVLCHPGIAEAMLRRLLGFEVTNAALVSKLLCGKNMMELAPGSSQSHKQYRVTVLGRDVLLAVEPRLATLEHDWTCSIGLRNVAGLQQMLGRLVSAHADKVRAPLLAIDEAMALPTWPMPPFPTYAGAHEPRRTASPVPAAKRGRQSRGEAS
ncbi:MarR family winged helix-turn-helix transcriptional regulator [Cupriavidus sp. 8B]